ncbi:protein takeout [Drosophila novamexicana]|uniref:protein takeout n=1 Tax=Drosophila novamexicana TaxID=47314 RepID=UPI0011E5ADE7|nr:protein takeout [Drosophila novamexicana]
MCKYYMLIIVLHTLYETALGAQLPEDIKKCHFGDSKCLIGSINDLIKRYPKGIPEIGLPPLDFTRLEDVAILDKPTVGAVWLTFYTRDNVNRGFNNATITHVDGFSRDPTKNIMIIEAHIPSVIHEATYDMLGRYLLFVANTTGKLKSDFQNVHLKLTIKGVLEYRNNKRYLKIYELKPKVELDRWIVWFDNLYRENTDLTIAVNRAFNENWLEFWNGLEPGLMKSFAQCFTGMLNKVFENVAYDDMFLPDVGENE